MRKFIIANSVEVKFTVNLANYIRLDFIALLCYPLFSIWSSFVRREYIYDQNQPIQKALFGFVEWMCFVMRNNSNSTINHVVSVHARIHIQERKQTQNDPK